jgi:serine/threonine protein kinase
MVECRWCGETSAAGGHCSACARPVAGDPRSQVGNTVANARIESFLGEGPIGASYAAVHLPSGSPVRVKLVDSALLSAEPELGDAVTQLVLGATGLHPSLPELVEIALDHPSGATISTEWVEGESLRQRLARGPLSAAEAARVAVGLLEALEALHAAGLSHRDIKPRTSSSGPKAAHRPSRCSTSARP